MRKDTVKKNEGSKAKGVLSAYNLFFMSSYRKTAAAILILLAVQAAVLIREMQGQKLYFESVAGGITLLPTLVGFLVLMYVLDDILGARKSNLDLTVRRLTIEPFSLFLTEAVYAMLVLFVYWALSAGLVYAAAVYFTENISQAANRETDVLLAFYRINNLNKLLPMRNVAAWLCDFAAIAALGIGRAAANRNIRAGRSRSSFMYVPMCLLIIHTGIFSESSGNTVVAAIYAVLYAAVGILAAVWTYNDEKEPSGEPTACSVGGDRKNVA